MGQTISGLYAITGETADTALLVDQVDAALRGGARMVQYRNKTGSLRHRAEQASLLADRVRAVGAVFIVNDSVDLAEHAGAHGVHLGRDDGKVGPARERLGPDAVIGVSCYDRIDRALAAESDGADYAAFGSFFPSGTKPDAVRAPIDLLHQAKKVLRIPIVAIGGINASNGASLLAAGADALAVGGALFSAEDVETAARTLSTLFRSFERFDCTLTTR
jgi:thiamine-phosphate pyrophosphorylase